MCDLLGFIGKLSGEHNLASMDWEDFEYLCHELFECVFASEGAERLR